MKKAATFGIIVIILIAWPLWDLMGLISRESGMYSSAQDDDGSTYIVIFLSNSEGNSLLPETRTAFTDKTGIEETVIRELIKGPKSPSLKETIPKGARLYSIIIHSKIAYVNFSKEFNHNKLEIPNPQDISISSVVNSLTQLPYINGVQFIIEGKEWGKPMKRIREALLREDMTPSEVMKKQMNLEKSGQWLEAYLLMSDNEENEGRKSYDQYINEMEEARTDGLLNAEFEVGEYKISSDDTNKASVKVIFITEDAYGKFVKGPEAYFNTVKIDGFWMVDWLTDYR